MKAFKLCASILLLICVLCFTSLSEAGRILKLPDKLDILSEEAFIGVNADKVVIPEGTTTIGSRVFSGSSINTVMLPESISVIAEDAFEGCSGLTACVYENSYAHKWCDAHGVQFLFYTPATSAEYFTTAVLPDGTLSITGFTGTDTSVVIPGEIGGMTVSHIGEKAFYNCDTALDITIPEGIVSIADYAFYNCSNLINVSFPDGLKEIGYAAFAYCPSLLCIEIPDSVVSIGGCAFYFSVDMFAAVIPAGVETIGKNAFWNSEDNFCIIGSKGSAAEAYANASGHEFAVYGSEILRTGSIETEEYYYHVVFESNANGISRSCTISSCRIDPVDLVINTSETVMGWTITGIDYLAFRNRYLLESLTVIGSLDHIADSAFSGCFSLDTVTVTGDLDVIDEKAFKDCDSLDTVSISGNVGCINPNAFKNCYSLTAVSVGGSLEIIEEDAFYDCESLASISIGKGSTTLNEPFYNCSLLRTFTCPDGVILKEYAFRGCSSLESISLSPLNTSIPANAFSGCSKLTGIVIPESVTTIGSGAFNNCISLTSVNIPEGVTSIEGNAFNNCSALTTVVVPESVETLGDGAFKGCTNLLSIILPDEMTKIGSYAFEGCKKLVSITLPEGIPGLYNRAFANCTSLRAIYIPPSVTYIAMDEAGADLSAFSNCRYDLICFGVAGSKAEERFPKQYFIEGTCADIFFSGDYVYTLNAIDVENGVYECSILLYEGSSSNLTIPASIDGYPLTGIHCYAFKNITLDHIRIESNITSIGNNAFPYVRDGFFITCPMKSGAQKFAQTSGLDFYLYDNDPYISGLYEAKSVRGKITASAPAALLELNNTIAKRLWAVDSYTYFTEHPLKSIFGPRGETLLFPGSTYDQYYEEAALVTLFYLCEGHETEAQDIINTLKDYQDFVDTAKFSASICDLIKLGKSGDFKVTDLLDDDYLDSLGDTLRSSLDDQILSIDLSVFDELTETQIKEGMEGVGETMIKSAEAILDMIMFNTYRNAILGSLDIDIQNLIMQSGSDSKYNAIFRKVLNDIYADQAYIGSRCFLKAAIDVTNGIDFKWSVLGRATKATIEGNADEFILLEAAMEEFTVNYLMKAWLPAKAAKIGFDIGSSSVDVFLFDTDEIGLQMRNFTLGYVTLSNAYKQLCNVVDNAPYMATRKQLDELMNAYMLYYQVAQNVYDIGDTLIDAIYSTEFSTHWNGLWTDDDPAQEWLDTLAADQESLDGNYTMVINWFDETLSDRI